MSRLYLLYGLVVIGLKGLDRAAIARALAE